MRERTARGASNRRSHPTLPARPGASNALPSTNASDTRSKKKSGEAEGAGDFESKAEQKQRRLEKNHEHEANALSPFAQHRMFEPIPQALEAQRAGREIPGMQQVREEMVQRLLVGKVDGKSRVELHLSRHGQKTTVSIAEESHRVAVKVEGEGSDRLAERLRDRLPDASIE